VAGLGGLLGGVDVLGWVITTGIWTDPSKALAPISKAYAGLGGVGALVATYVGLLVLTTAGAAALRADVGRFALGFTAVFWISYLCWIIGSYANFAVNAGGDEAFIAGRRVEVASQYRERRRRWLQEHGPGPDPIGPIYGDMRAVNFCSKTEDGYTVENSSRAAGIPIPKLASACGTSDANFRVKGTLATL
jgi:hypothetical protein